MIPLEAEACAETSSAGAGTWSRRRSQMASSAPVTLYDTQTGYHADCTHAVSKILQLVGAGSRGTSKSRHFFRAAQSCMAGLLSGAAHEQAHQAALYGWVPSQCSGESRLQPASFASRFAARGSAGPSQLVFAGDSSTGQQLLSLICLLWGEVATELHPHRLSSTALTPEAAAIATSPLAPTPAAFVLRGGGLVQMARSDFLTSGRHLLSRCIRLRHGRCTQLHLANSIRTKETKTAGLCQLPIGLGVPQLASSDEDTPMGRGDAPRLDESWTARLRYGVASSRDVLVLNSGLHWAARIDKFGNSTVIPAYECVVLTILEYLNTADYRGRVFYRTNYAPGCGSSMQPDRAALGASQGKHGWYRLALFDDVWARLGPQLRPGFRVLNVSIASSQRVDAHCSSNHDAYNASDCVHFVMPGPVDAWNAMLSDAIVQPA